MRSFSAKDLAVEPDAIAPDGSEVRLLCGLDGGGMAQFRLAPGQVSRAVTHRTVEEIWYFIEGTGEMWRSQDGEEEVTAVHPGLSLTVPLGTVFQFRSDPAGYLTAVGVTMPPWPGEDEAEQRKGPWTPTI